MIALLTWTTPATDMLAIRVGHLPLQRTSTLKRRHGMQPAPALKLHHAQSRQLAAPIHACSSAAAQPSVGPSKPPMGGILMVFAAFFRAVSQAVQKTAQKVRHVHRLHCLYL